MYNKLLIITLQYLLMPKQLQTEYLVDLLVLNFRLKLAKFQNESNHQLVDFYPTKAVFGQLIIIKLIDKKHNNI